MPCTTASHHIKVGFTMGISGSISLLFSTMWNLNNTSYENYPVPIYHLNNVVKRQHICCMILSNRLMMTSIWFMMDGKVKQIMEPKRFQYFKKDLTYRYANCLSLQTGKAHYVLRLNVVKQRIYFITYSSIVKRPASCSRQSPSKFNISEHCTYTASATQSEMD